MHIIIIFQAHKKTDELAKSFYCIPNFFDRKQSLNGKIVEYYGLQSEKKTLKREQERIKKQTSIVISPLLSPLILTLVCLCACCPDFRRRQYFVYLPILTLLCLGAWMPGLQKWAVFSICSNISPILRRCGPARTPEVGSISYIFFAILEWVATGDTALSVKKTTLFVMPNKMVTSWHTLNNVPILVF